MTANGASPIETLQVGDRVLTNDATTAATEVDPLVWSKVTLQMPNLESPGDVLDIKLLRSVAWMAKVGCAKGATIWFDLEEMGLHGWAEVTDVEACPSVKNGVGRVVLATVTHFNSYVMEIQLQGVDEVLQPTDRHRLFSVTRNDWIPAAQLRPGEKLATCTGIVRIDSIKHRPGTHRVYNIEVETEHCFYAGAAQVLSHNVNPCAAPPPKKIETPHTIEYGGNKTASAPPTGKPNSIHEQIRPDGSKRVTYYDEAGRPFSKEDYGQLREHGVLGKGSDGKSVPHEHRTEFSDKGPIGKQYRELNSDGKPVGPWHND